eukprot:c16425_g1_i3.p1 GENE.c16425_g1_i3~~c16425_g1_i3.p1  ORF type:complete len:416 (+),score=67.39 c16425_g1_i3:942-2189(+)
MDLQALKNQCRQNLQSRGETVKEVEYAPIWTPNSAQPTCAICKEKWTLLNRRHHCRQCGGLVCGNCSQLVLKAGKPTRMCNTCGESIGSRIRIESSRAMAEGLKSVGLAADSCFIEQEWARGYAQATADGANFEWSQYSELMDKYRKQAEGICNEALHKTISFQAGFTQGGFDASTEKSTYITQAGAIEQVAVKPAKQPRRISNRAIEVLAFVVAIAIAVWAKTSDIRISDMMSIALRHVTEYVNFVNWGILVVLMHPAFIVVGGIVQFFLLLFPGWVVYSVTLLCDPLAYIAFHYFNWGLPPLVIFAYCVPTALLRFGLFILILRLYGVHVRGRVSSLLKTFASLHFPLLLAAPVVIHTQLSPYADVDTLQYVNNTPKLPSLIHVLILTSAMVLDRYLIVSRTEYTKQIQNSAK